MNEQECQEVNTFYFLFTFTFYFVDPGFFPGSTF